MANFTSGNNENIHQLLSQHNFNLINQKIDDYKCVICQRILINAYQAYCGCNYCEKCVDKQVRSGVLFCPGDTGECKTAALSNVFIDQKTNKQISQLVVKCPEEMCCYESQLRDMGDHLQFCGKKNVECPFIDFGCDQGKLNRDELNEHLQQESYRHSEILIDVIGSFRNELAELKRDREEYDASDKENDIIIESMREEIESMKIEKTTLEQRVDNLGNILDGKVDKIVAEIVAKLEEMKREWRGAMEQQQLALANVEAINELKYRTEIAQRIDSMEKSLSEKINADFVWTIDNISEKRWNKEWVFSEYFNGCSEPYKMRLRCYNDISELQIYFRIYPDQCDESLQWPFDRNITIAITNQMRPKARKSITKRRTIAKPSKNLYPWSDPFIFDWNELSTDGLLHDNRLTVQCFIRNG